jgi:Tol biopolymer transport system component
MTDTTAGLLSLPRTRHWPTLSAVCAAALLAACGGGGGGASSSGGALPTVSVSVVVSTTLASGESFSFGLGTAQINVTQTSTATFFPNRLSVGAGYGIVQLGGPRNCSFSASANGTAGAVDIVVTADCGSPPDPNALAGQFYGPVGASLTLHAAGLDDLSLLMPPVSNSRSVYNQMVLAFTPLPASGSAYTISMDPPTLDLLCSVYQGASGTLPVAIGAVRVGCEERFDLFSRSSDDTTLGTYGLSAAPVIGGGSVSGNEGRYVAFVSSAGLAGNATGVRQVYWRDRLTGVTRLVSASAGGAPGNGDSAAPSLSADGQTVVFESLAGNLIGDDSNGVSDIYLWSASAPTAGVQRVSVGPGGAQANGASSEPALSGDARVLAYTSTASNLTSGVSGTSTVNVYRRDLGTGVTTLVSRDGNGLGVGGSRPSISADGARLAFHSFSDSLVAGDSNGLWDIFVHDQPGNSLQRVSLTSTGAERDAGTETAARVVAPSLSGNGRYVAYASTAADLVPGDTNGAQDVFVVDTQPVGGGVLPVVRASVSSSGVQGDADSPVEAGERVALSFDGNRVAYTSLATTLGAPARNVLLHTVSSGLTQALTTHSNSFVGPVAMSRNGAYVVFGDATVGLDPRFNTTGLFARYTGLAPAFAWKLD